MYFPKLTLTDVGRALIVKALNGGAIVFSKVSIGNGGAPGNIREITELVNPVTDITINAITPGEGCVQLDATYDNSSLDAGFYAREVGIFANDPDDGEILYAYANAGNDAAYIPAYSVSATVKTAFHFVVAVGDATEVTAIIGEYTGFVGKEELASHTENKNNPHRVTAAQVGLGNVPNVAPQNQQPTFTISDNVNNLVNFASGEHMSTILQKIHSSIATLIDHLAKKNPHGITTKSIGAAEATHYHAANSITSGVLPLARGGTGVQTVSALAVLLQTELHAPVVGTYAGNDARQRLIPLDFTPTAVFVMPTIGVLYDDTMGNYGGLAVTGMGVKTPNCQIGHDATWSNKHTVLLISTDPAKPGFYVNYYDAEKVYSNRSGYNYTYIAFR